MLCSSGWSLPGLCCVTCDNSCVYASTGRARVRQAVILAGGRGRRLRPYTDDRPKPMVELNGKPILRHQLEWLAESGVEQVVVAAGYRARVIVDYLAATRLPMAIQVVVEPTPLGRGGALKFAARSLPWADEAWFALNGDICARFSLADLASHHCQQDVLATLAMPAAPTTWRAVECDAAGRVRRLLHISAPSYRVNGGIYVFAPEFAALLPDTGDHEQRAFDSLIEAGKLSGCHVEGFWRSINTAAELAHTAAELDVQSRLCLAESRS